MGVVMGLDSVIEDRFDRDDAALFLRAQAGWLQRGLAAPADETCRARVLAAHDGSHDSWLSLVAAVDRGISTDAAAAVATLYALHGRVAATVDRGPDPLLPVDAQAAVRDLLAARLVEVTDETCQLLSHESQLVGVGS